MRTGKLVLLALLCASVPAFAQYRHAAFNSESPPTLPKKVLVIPAEVRVQEISAGGVMTRVPELTVKASANLSESTRRYLINKKSLEASADLPALTDMEKDQLDDYLATFYMVSLSAFNTTQYGGSAWEHKRRNFDYSLGRGLAFLKDKTGADAALMIVGDDVVTTGGRKAAAVIGALVGVVVPMGRSVVYACMVDLTTGDLLWINSALSGSKDLSNESSAASMVADILAPYPLGK
jgi:hypothetical protein